MGLFSRTVSILTLSIVAAASAFASPDAEFTCPPDIRAQVTTPLEPGWVATSQSARPHRAVIETIAGQRVMACKYRMFGTDYTVYRAYPPGHDRCFANELGEMRFHCYLVGHR